MSQKFPYSRQVRLDPDTLAALDQISRFTFQTKCGLIRSYVAKCVADDLVKYQHQVQKVKSMTSDLATA
jgi:hypothetical protein